MAAPITSIKMKELTADEIQHEKLLELQLLLTKQEQAINKILEITGGLDDAGVLDAVKAMVKAKDEIAEIAVGQVSREPVTNLINHVLNASGMLTTISPDVTEKLARSVESGLNEAEFNGNNETIGVFDLIKSLKDPDVNRAVKFGMHFLKGMGKGLNGE